MGYDSNLLPLGVGNRRVGPFIKRVVSDHDRPVNKVDWVRLFMYLNEPVGISLLTVRFWPVLK